MSASRKTKAQLLDELKTLRARVVELEHKQSERRPSERVLRESESRYREVASNIPGMIYQFVLKRDGSFAIPFAVEGSRTTLEFTPEELQADLALVVSSIHRDDIEGVRQSIAESARTLRTWTAEFRFVRRGGKIQWVQSIASPRLLIDGSILWDGLAIDITERKRAEEELRKYREQLEELVEERTQALQETTERYRAIFEQAAGSVVLFDTETGAMMEFNDRAHENLGYTREEFEGITLVDIEALESPAETAKHIEKLIEEGADVFETKQRRKNGELRNIAVSSRIIDVRGRKLIAAIWQDITERKQAEEALRESEERYRAVVESQSELICRFLPGETITFVNEAYCRYFGKKQDELVGQDFLLLIPERDREFVKNRIDSLSPENPVVTHEHRVVRSTGETGWQQWTNRAVFDEQGHVTEYQAVGRDITERKRAEEALRESEEKYRTLVDGAGTPIMYIDLDGRVLLVNTTGARNLGGKPEDFVGQSVYKVLPDKADVTPERIRQVIEAGAGCVFEDLVELPSGGRWFMSTLQPVRHASGEVFAIQIVSQDITERKLAEAALQESEAKWRSITEHSPDYIMLLDREAKIMFINRTVPDLTKEQVLGTPIYDHVPEEYKPVMRECFERVLGTGEPDRFEIVYHAADGDIRRFEGRVGPVKDSGQIVGLTVSSTDLTAHERTNESL